MARRYNRAMYIPLVAAWMARRALFSPKGLVWMAFCLLSLPFLALFTPHGLLESESPVVAQVAQLALLGQTLGCALAVLALEECRWILDLASPVRRLLGRLSGLGATASMGWGLVLLSAWLTFGAEGLPALDSFLFSALGILQLCLLAAVLLELPALGGSRPALLLFLTLLLPALVPSQQPELAWIRGLFQVQAMSPGWSDSHGIELWVPFGPMIVLGVALGFLVLLRLRPLSRP